MVIERGGGEEVRSAVEWAQVRAMVADGVSEREIAVRLGINRRTVRRLAEADEPPRYERTSAGSMLDPLEPVIRRLIDEWPQIKAPARKSAGSQATGSADRADCRASQPSRLRHARS